MSHGVNSRNVFHYLCRRLEKCVDAERR